MSKWDKSDHQAWNNSEVMLEFEKKLLKALVNIDNDAKELQQKKAQQAAGISKKLDTINKSVKSTSDSMNKFLESAKNLAKDNKNDSDESEEFEEVYPEPTEEEQKIAKENLLIELNQLASKAASERNIKLAYKIERIINTIMFEE